MIAEPLKTGFFKVMEQEILIWNEKNDPNPYRLYEHLKQKARSFGIDPEVAAKIIAKELDI